MLDIQSFNVSASQIIAFANVDYKIEDEMFNYLAEKKLNLQALESINNPKRKVEWMSIRYLLGQVVENFIDIVYDSEGRPHLKNHPYHLSISHSYHRVGVSINKEAITGIDIQHITPKILRIRDKFLKELEVNNLNLNDSIKLTIAWSIKEALFKVYGKNDIYLKENISIEELTFNNNIGKAKGTITNGNYKSTHELEFKLEDEYVMAYAVNS